MRWVALAAVLLACKSGPDEGLSKSIEAQRPQIAALRATLAELGTTLPATTELPSMPKLDPPATYRESPEYDHSKPISERLDRSNLAILTLEQLANPTQSPDQFWWFSSDFERAFMIEKLKIDDDEGKGTLMSWDDAFKRALATKYLAVIHIREWKKAEVSIKDDKLPTPQGELAGTFRPGQLKTRVYIVDLPAKKLIGGWDFDVDTPPDVSFSYDWRNPGAKSVAAASATEQAIFSELKRRVRFKLEGLGDVKFN